MARCAASPSNWSAKGSGGFYEEIAPPRPGEGLDSLGELVHRPLHVRIELLVEHRPAAIVGDAGGLLRSPFELKARCRRDLGASGCRPTSYLSSWPIQVSSVPSS